MQTRIMVVDDEEVTGRMLLYQLQICGYEAFHLRDGLQALQRVLIEQPDLILLDVMMPHVNGWEVCREIRACSSVPIIMVTGKDADDDIVTGLAAGADDYVTKPFNIAQLQARIEAVLRRTRQPALASVSAVTALPAYDALPELERRVAAIELPDPTPAQRAAVIAPDPWRQLVADPAPAAPQRLGDRLRDERQGRGMSLYQAERLCRVRWDYLQALEQEHWEYVPSVQLQSVLATYATLLRIDLGRYRPQQSLAPRFAFPATATMIIGLVLLLLVITLVVTGGHLL
jgi:CheY-like chemotaxis protein